MLALALGDPLHGRAERHRGDPGLVLEGRERAQEGGRQNPAEVADHGADRRAHAGLVTSWTPSPRLPSKRNSMREVVRRAPSPEDTSGSPSRSAAIRMGTES